MCGTPVIFPQSIGCCDAIADHAKHIFRPGDAADLRRVIEQAVQTPRSREPISREAILYDADVSVHVAELLALANDIHASR
jgi:hypothetical protein